MDPNKKKARGRLGIAAFALVALISCSCCVRMWFVGSASLDATMPAAVACDGSPVAGAPPRSATGNAILAFSRLAGGPWHLEHDRMVVPQQWREAERVGEASVVLCIEPSTATAIETCSYEGGATFVRHQHQRRVRAVEAATGQLLRELVLTGGAPPVCPDSRTRIQWRQIDLPDASQATGSVPGEREIFDAFRDSI